MTKYESGVVTQPLYGYQKPSEGDITVTFSGGVLVTPVEVKEEETKEEETKLVCKYNVTSTSEPTTLRTNYEQNIFKSMEVGGRMLDELVTAYTFDSTGVHTVKYELYDETKLGNNTPLFNNDNLIEITIPDSVTTICDYVFYGCSGLTSVSIDSNAIVSSAYTSSTNMKNIFGPQVEEYIIGSGVTSIGDYAFYNCSALTSVTFDENSQIATIGTATFDGCTSLTSINIPNSITSIGDAAFYTCTSLTSVTITATTPPTLGLDAFNVNASGRKIYVPSESVNAYKSASGWSAYADSIFPII